MISAIIPCHNDLTHLQLVIDNLCEGINPSELEIIVVNDGSVLSTGLPMTITTNFGRSNVRVINRPVSRGVGAAFDFGVKEAVGEAIIILGADVLVEPISWLKHAKKCLLDHPRAINVATCVGISPEDMNFKDKTRRYGAELLLQVSIDDLPPDSDIRKYHPDYTELFKAKWLEGKLSNDPYPIPCALGAFYVVSKEWYNHIGGFDTDPAKRFQGHLIYGSLEPLISLKSWLCGGEVIVHPEFEVGHLFQRGYNGARSADKAFWNQIWIAETCILDDELRKRVMAFKKPELNWGVAQKRIRQNYTNVLEVRERNRQRFVHDLKWFMDKFKIELK